jgi:hypothetical protein
VTHSLEHGVPYVLSAIKSICFLSQHVRPELSKGTFYPLPPFGIFGNTAAGASRAPQETCLGGQHCSCKSDMIEPIPSSPPTKSPPAEAKKYVAKSPNVVGLSKGVMSGIGSIQGMVSNDRNWCRTGVSVPVRPLAKTTLVGFSRALNASKITLRVVRSWNAT